MTIVRAYEGPDPGHPVTVVPTDPGRRGALVRVRGWEVAVADPHDAVETLEDLGAAARDIGWDGPRLHGLPPFTGGLVGVLTDELSPGLLGLVGDDGRRAPAPLPPMWFGLYGGAACRDPEGGWWLVGETPDDVAHAEVLLREAAAGTTSGTTVGAGSSPTPSPAPGRVGARGVAAEGEGDAGLPTAWTSLDRAAHADAVARIQGWIADGDVYQVNLTMHVAARWPGSPRSLARALFGATEGAAHAAFLHVPGGTVASVSPETFLRVDGRRAVVRPIKGTRRRAATAAEDVRLAADLQAAVKDRAEHVMIVDLERNDLGRICEVGSVRVPELMVLEGHPTVWHLTSTVEGVLRQEVGVAEVVAALFPCGSVTGAPKRMAVDRIRLVEPWRRGVYCGAIGAVSRGLVDLSVAIRTAVVHDGWAVYGTGGGIVADSDADAEWDEAMAKASAFFTATATLPPD